MGLEDQFEASMDLEHPAFAFVPPSAGEPGKEGIFIELPANGFGSPVDTVPAPAYPYRLCSGIRQAIGHTHRQ